MGNKHTMSDQKALLPLTLQSISDCTSLGVGTSNLGQKNTLSDRKIFSFDLRGISDGISLGFANESHGVPIKTVSILGTDATSESEDAEADLSVLVLPIKERISIGKSAANDQDTDHHQYGMGLIDQVSPASSPAVTSEESLFKKSDSQQPAPGPLEVSRLQSGAGEYLKSVAAIDESVMTDEHERLTQNNTSLDPSAKLTDSGHDVTGAKTVDEELVINPDNPTISVEVENAHETERLTFMRVPSSTDLYSKHSRDSLLHDYPDLHKTDIEARAFTPIPIHNGKPKGISHRLSFSSALSCRRSVYVKRTASLALTRHRKRFGRSFFGAPRKHIVSFPCYARCSLGHALLGTESRLQACLRVAKALLAEKMMDEGNGSSEEYSTIGVERYGSEDAAWESDEDLV